MITQDFTVPTFANATDTSPVSIWRQISKGKIKAYKIGRSTRIPFSELERLRNENQIQPKHP
jgi:excisionase family DNA binding protein